MAALEQTLLQEPPSLQSKRIFFPHKNAVYEAEFVVEFMSVIVSWSARVHSPVTNTAPGCHGYAPGIVALECFLCSRWVDLKCFPLCTVSSLQMVVAQQSVSIVWMVASVDYNSGNFRVNFFVCDILCSNTFLPHGNSRKLNARLFTYNKHFEFLIFAWNVRCR